MTLEKEIMTIADKHTVYLENNFDYIQAILWDDVPYFVREIIELIKKELEN